MEMKLVSLTFQFIMNIAVISLSLPLTDNDHQMVAEIQYIRKQADTHVIHHSVIRLPPLAVLDLR